MCRKKIYSVLIMTAVFISLLSVPAYASGDVATDVACSAMRAGSESASLFCLESRENMPASVVDPNKGHSL
jgi:hypothetical protein